MKFNQRLIRNNKMMKKFNKEFKEIQTNIKDQLFIDLSFQIKRECKMLKE